MPSSGRPTGRPSPWRPGSAPAAAAWLLVVCVVALLPPALPARGQGAPETLPPVLSADRLELPVAAGIRYEHLDLLTAEGPLQIHQLRVDLAQPTLQLGVGLAHDRLMSEDETVSSMVTRSGAIAGVNGDYFDIHQSGMPLNIVVRNGELLRSPWRWVAFVVGWDGTARIVRYRWTGTLLLPETGEVHPLDGYNSGLSPEGIVALSNVRGYGAPPPEPGVRQVVVELTPTGEAGRYFVKQVWPQQAFYAPFPAGEMVLVGRGRGAEWLEGKLTAGTVVAVNLTTDPDWHEARLAIGGGPLLVDGGRVVDDPDPPAPKERDQRNPVIAVGIGPDGRTLTFVEVDGRQPTLSIGLTRPQLAGYMLQQGAVQAMAFDSGGSATMVVRLPGAPTPAVVNSPSDGRERPVADALLVYSSAVPGPPARLLVNAGRALRLFPGARVALSVVGVDGQGNPTALPDPVEVTPVPDLVSVAPGPSVVAGRRAGTGTLMVRSGALAASVPVTVVTRLGRLLVTPPAARVVAGAGLRFELRAQDASGRPVILPPSLGSWILAPPWLGAISPRGEFAAGDAGGAGTATVRAGGALARAQIAVVGTARPLSALWSFRGYPETVTGETAIVSAPARGGSPSLRLSYRLEGTGTRAAYAAADVPLPGSPSGIVLWVRGDGSGVWLRAAYVQSGGVPGVLTLARHVTWRGWRPVVAFFPPGTVYPVVLKSLYVVETDPDLTPSGTLYLSGLRAIYGVPAPP
jgi:hypothetical protein